MYVDPFAVCSHDSSVATIQNGTAGTICEVTVIINDISSQDRLLYYARKMVPLVWCMSVPMKNALGLDIKCGVGIPDDQIAVGPGRNRTFRSLLSAQGCRGR